MGERSAREILRNFYDSYGWKVDPQTGRYLDQVLFVDPDELAQRYMEKGELRYLKYFRGGGRYFLDAGCGAKPRRALAQNYARHVCVDISILGLRECRRKIGESGHYVLADMTSMPFAENAFYGTLASHCLYHIDRHEQVEAVNELYRVTNPEETVLLFYNSDYNLVTVIQRAVRAVAKLMDKLIWLLGSWADQTPLEATPITPPPIYFHAHNPFLLARKFKIVNVSCLSILTRYETRMLGKLHILKLVLPLVNALETAFPVAMVVVGKYTAIRITVEP